MAEHDLNLVGLDVRLRCECGMASDTFKLFPWQFCVAYSTTLRKCKGPHLCTAEHLLHMEKWSVSQIKAETFP